MRQKPSLNGTYSTNWVKGKFSLPFSEIKLIKAN